MLILIWIFRVWCSKIDIHASLAVNFPVCTITGCFSPPVSLPICPCCVSASRLSAPVLTGTHLVFGHCRASFSLSVTQSTLYWEKDRQTGKIFCCSVQLFLVFVFFNFSIFIFLPETQVMILLQLDTIFAI